MRKASLLIAVLAQMAIASPARAATVIVDVTEDLTTYNLSGSSLNFFNTPLSATLSEGDVLDLRVDFLGGQTLMASTLSALTAGIWGSSVSGNATITGGLSFYNPTGPLVSSGLDTDTGCCIHIANTFNASQLLSGPGPVSFSGFRLLGTVDDYDSNVPHNYTLNFSSISGSGFSIGSIDGVPEPSTWLMMLVGYGAIGFAMRRKQRKTLSYSFT